MQGEGFAPGRSPQNFGKILNFFSKFWKSYFYTAKLYSFISSYVYVVFSTQFGEIWSFLDLYVLSNALSNGNSSNKRSIFARIFLLTKPTVSYPSPIEHLYPETLKNSLHEVFPWYNYKIPTSCPTYSHWSRPFLLSHFVWKVSLVFFGNFWRILTEITKNCSNYNKKRKCCGNRHTTYSEGKTTDMDIDWITHLRTNANTKSEAGS